MTEKHDRTLLIHQKYDVIMCMTSLTVLNKLSSITERLHFRDILPTILRHLSSPKERIRLELVSREFRECAKSVEAWSNNAVISIRNERQEHYRTNGCQITVSVELMSSAIKSILIRHRNVKAIDLHYLSSAIYQVQTTLQMYRSIFETIEQLGIHSFENLQTLLFDGVVSSQITRYIRMIIGSFKHQLKALSVTFLRFDNNIDATEWWETVGACVGLKRIDIILNTDAATSVEMVRNALRGKAMKSVGCLNITADDLINVICSLADHSSALRHLTCGRIFHSDPFSLVEFAQRLPTIHWTNLRHFTYRNYSDDSKPDIPVLMRLRQLCPQLKSLTLDAWEDNNFVIRPRHIFDLIVTYMKTQNECTIRYSAKPITIVALIPFWLSLDILNLIYKWLIESHQFTVVPFENLRKETFLHISLGKYGNIHLYTGLRGALPHVSLKNASSLDDSLYE
jgi:hypothetical protein